MSTPRKAITTPHKVTVGHKPCGDWIKNETLIVTRGRLANAVVFLEDVPFDGELEPEELTLDQRGCVFVPRVQAGVKGSKLLMLNNDHVLHNIHAYWRKEGKRSRTLFNRSLHDKGVTTRKKIKKTGLIEMVCDAGHTWMAAYLYLFDHPYYAVTGKDGAFKIDGVPSGTYKLRVWHETLGELEQTVTIAAEGSSEANIEMP